MILWLLGALAAPAFSVPGEFAIATDMLDYEEFKKTVTEGCLDTPICVGPQRAAFRTLWHEYALSGNGRRKKIRAAIQARTSQGHTNWYLVEDDVGLPHSSMGFAGSPPSVDGYYESRARCDTTVSSDGLHSETICKSGY